MPAPLLAWPAQPLKFLWTTSTRVAGDLARLDADGFVEVVFVVEDHGKPFSNQGLVVDNHHADAHDELHSTGRRAVTRNPPPRRGPASKLPPSKDARSRIPTSP